MRRSDDRILTTHTGSLNRPEHLVALMFAVLEGKDVDPAELAASVRKARVELLLAQQEAGVDVVSDGEVSKQTYVTYVQDRFTGFGGQSPPLPISDLGDYPEAAAPLFADGGFQHLTTPACIGPVAMARPDAVRDDVEGFRSALDEVGGGEGFLTAPSPGTVAMFLANQHYPTREEYLTALADALRVEYQAIVDAGLILQVDSPDVGCSAHVAFPGEPLDTVKRHVEENLAVLDHALRDLPPEQLRMHVCWGNYSGPHHHDIEFREVARAVLAARPTAISVEAANPRHAHEWQVFAEIPLPDGKTIVPGVIDSANPTIEHPDLVAQRIQQYASLVGRENVIAGTDCGFGTFVGQTVVPVPVAWAKLRSLAEGARRASAALWAS
jgi:5-methyltetrahydropteroyltriglutamate--homocysteine methyltransferase